MSYEDNIPDDADSEEESQNQETGPPKILLPGLLLEVPEDQDAQEEARGGPADVTHVAHLQYKLESTIKYCLFYMIARSLKLNKYEVCGSFFYFITLGWGRSLSADVDAFNEYSPNNWSFEN